MSVHEKIRLVRLAKGWTQENLAEKLEMSVNGYGDLERGNRDIKLSKLEQISELLGVDLADLFSVNEKGVFNLSTGRSKQHNKNYCNIGSSSFEISELNHELEKQTLLNSQQSKEIELLKEVIALMKKENSD
jgi:transcriptional regulator with XRE-family HTH domain